MNNDSRMLTTIIIAKNRLYHLNVDEVAVFLEKCNDNGLTTTSQIIESLQDIADIVLDGNSVSVLALKVQLKLIRQFIYLIQGAIKEDC
jgi:hypothetical protein